MIFYAQFVVGLGDNLEIWNNSRSLGEKKEDRKMCFIFLLAARSAENKRDEWSASGRN